MWYKILAVFIVLIALSVAVLMSFWQQEALHIVIFLTRFFDMMLPVLAVGALLKYLFGSCNGVCKKED